MMDKTKLENAKASNSTRSEDLAVRRLRLQREKASAAVPENLLPMGNRRLTKPLHWLQMGRLVAGVV
jgi:hypothetical protein